MDLIDRIDHWGRTAPDKTAHISGDRRLTYGELVRRSDALAAQLAAELPPDGSPVAVVGHKEPEMLVAFLGAVKAGHPYIPLDTSLPQQRIEQIIATAGARLTLTPESIAVRSQPGTAAKQAACRRVGPNDPYYIIFTSGSTGEPKGVVITLACLTSFVDWMQQEQQLPPTAETFLNQAPFSFDLSVMDLYLSLSTGGTLFSIHRDEIANMKHLFLALRRSAISTWVSTPSFAQMCLAEPTFGEAMLPQLRRFLFCGETLTPGVATQLLQRFPAAAVWNTYGPTEATVATTSVRIDAELLARYAPLPVGRPKPDARILTVGEDGEAVADGERGEIIIAGPNVSPGYLRRPELTARAFFTLDGQQAYRTGDWGRYRDGLLFFEGRIDSQIKLHGYRIELGEIEAALRKVEGVHDAIVLVVSKDGRPDSLSACVIFAQRPAGTDFELSRLLRGKLAEQLPAYMLPRRFHFMDAFPMTANGKADRRKLAEALV